MRAKFTVEEVDSQLKVYSLKRISEYKNVRSRIICVDDKGYKFNVRFCGLKRGETPGKFNPANPYTLENISLWLKLNHKPITLMEGQTYKGNAVPLNFKCNKCLEVYDILWGSVQAGQGCPYCRGMRVGASNNLAKARPDLVRYFESIDDSYLFSPSSNKKVHLVCPNCNKKKKYDRMSINISWV